jgi:hypothetical protein
MSSQKGCSRGNFGPGEAVIFRVRSASSCFIDFREIAAISWDALPGLRQSCYLSTNPAFWCSIRTHISPTSEDQENARFSHAKILNAIGRHFSARART